MVRGWLDRGVDGFRLDVFNAFLKHPELPSNPRSSAARPRGTRQDHLYDRDQPDLAELIGRFRAIVDEEPGPDVGRRAVRRRPRAGRGRAIPADKSNYGMFTVLDDLSRQRTRGIIEESAKDPNSKIGAAYDTLPRHARRSRPRASRRSSPG